MIDYTKVESGFGPSLKNWVEFASWARWHPDLWLDLCKGENNGFRLDMDQRVLMRSLARFYSTYGCLTRGSGKTFLQQAVQYVVAVWYPGVTLSVTAQTKENASKLLKDKYAEIIRAWPLLENEIAKRSFTANEAYILFKNGSRIDALANSQTSKGQRRKRINVEESVLCDAETFQDAIEPIVEVPRYTMGRLGLVDPCELNQQINFFSTPGWRGSTEHIRSIDMMHTMIDLGGKMVIGADWMIPCWYGRGSSKAQILAKRASMSSVAFAQNYGGTWTGSSDGALVDVNKLLACRTLDNAIMRAQKESDEYYFGVDVARSQKTNNNQSSLAIMKVDRDPMTNKIKYMNLVNMVNISNVLNFSTQAAIIKRYAQAYNPRMVILDGNGLGTGLVDKLLEANVDPSTGEQFEPWNTVNTTNQGATQDAKRCLFDLKAQGLQSRIITLFIDAIDSGKLRMLSKREDLELYAEFRKDESFDATPYIQTDLLFAEVANLKLKNLPNGNLTVEKVVRKLDKDRFSALAYVVYYISEYTSVIKPKNDIQGFVPLIRPPKFR